MNVIECKNISKNYHLGKNKIPILKEINLKIKKAEYISILGTSGSGKTTLLNILGCLDEASSGTYLINQTNISLYSKKKLNTIRNKEIGFIFQSFNLLSRYNVYSNVELPLLYAKIDASRRKDKVQKAIKQVGLSDRIKHKPSELSGGQKQRVAIARALVNNPSIIIADEPTGNLDSKTSDEILSLFEALVHQGNTIIMVTHDLKIAKHTQRTIELFDGKIIKKNKRKS